MRAVTVRWVVVVMLLAFYAAPAPAATIVYTQANAPATPKVDDLPLKQSVSQYGITWTFDKPARVGQFITGDWYVVGPVTITAIESQAPFWERCAGRCGLDRRAKEG